VVSTIHSRQTLRFSVIDTGIGIPESDRHHLFHSFSQVDASTTRRYGGTGLGLAISRQLSGLMGGEIGFESKEGSGSTFWFTVPLARQISDRRRQWLCETGLKHRRVLLADAHARSQAIIRKILEGRGCRVKDARSAEEALNQMKTAASGGDGFDVAILDRKLEHFDPAEFGAAVQADPAIQEVALVLLATTDVRHQAEDSKKFGFTSVLFKPVKRAQIYRAVAPNPHFDEGSTSSLGSEGAEKQETTMQRGEKIRILLAEDNAINRTVAVRMLERLGPEIDCVSDGREALEALRTHSYDLVLMDVQMPVIDGLEATRRIRASREEFNKIPIIALTANAMKGDRELCLEAGMDDYLSKPIDRDALQRCLERWLAAV